MSTEELQGWDHRSELRGLTALRGIAALIVVVYHLEAVVVERGGPFVLGPLTSVVRGGYVFVDLFFVLSGVVIAHVYGQRKIGGDLRRYLTFLRNRLARIYPLHLVVLLVLAIPTFGRFMNGADNVFSSSNSAPALVSELLLLDSIGLHDLLTWNSVSWSISAEWFAYLLAPLILMLVRPSRSTVQTGAAVLAIAWVGLVVLWAMTPEAPTFNLGGVRGVLGFVVGVGLYRVHRADPVVRYAQRVEVFVAAMLAIGVVSFLDANEALFIPPFALLIVAAIHSTGRLASVLQSRVLLWLGKISYSVYLVQTVFLLAVINASPQLALSERSAGEVWLWSAIWIAALLGVSTLTYRRVEIPAQKVLRHRKSEPKTVNEPATTSS